MANLISRIQDVQTKLLQLDYAVTCTLTDTGCMLKLPLRIATPEYPHVTTEYTIAPGKLVYSIRKGSELIAYNKIPAPKYAIKSIIIADIVLACKLINYNPGAVVFFNGLERISDLEFKESIPIKLSKNDKVKDLGLYTILCAVLERPELKLEILAEIAGEKNILKGYNVMIALLGASDELLQRDRNTDTV